MTLVFMVLAIGFSRVGLGVHYVSDVVAGFALGAAWVAAMAAVFSVMCLDRPRLVDRLPSGGLQHRD